jgi:hypothetical protein
MLLCAAAHGALSAGRFGNNARGSNGPARWRYIVRMVRALNDGQQISHFQRPRILLAFRAAMRQRSLVIDHRAAGRFSGD